MYVEALSAEPKVDLRLIDKPVDTPPQEEIVKDDLFQKAALNGHTNWLIGVLKDQKHFAFKRVKEQGIHNGALGRDTLDYVVQQSQGINLLDDQQRMNFITNVLDFAKRDFERILASPYVSQQDKKLLEHKAELFLREFEAELRINPPDATVQWIQFLQGTPEDPGFIYQNDNWGRNAHKIKELVEANTKNKSELLGRYEAIRKDLLSFQKLKTINQIEEFINKQSMSNASITILDLLVETHKGWRKEYYNLDGEIKEEDFESSFYTVFRNPVLGVQVREELRMLENLIKYRLGSAAETDAQRKEANIELIKQRIDAFRKGFETSLGITPKYTFALLVKLALGVQAKIDEFKRNSQMQIPLEAMQEILNSLIYTIKQDANPAAVDALIELAA